MPIKIEEVAKMVYTAEVTPPSGGGSYWKTPHPMEIRELIPALQALGCSKEDIDHAFEDLGAAQYRQMAALTEPVLQEALAGTRSIPPQPVYTEAWMGYSLYFSKEPVSLVDFFDTADYINHAIPTPEVVAWGFLKLKERGWLEVRGDKYGLTEEGRMVIGMQVNHGAVERVAKWMSEHPAPETETWVRRFLEKRRAKSD